MTEQTHPGGREILQGGCFKPERKEMEQRAKTGRGQVEMSPGGGGAGEGEGAGSGCVKSGQ